jgi:hypothetical protein
MRSVQKSGEYTQRICLCEGFSDGEAVEGGEAVREG